MYVCDYALEHEIKQLEGSNYYGTFWCANIVCIWTC
jgi:hypothetical protein